jgi:hypothetical protein
MGMESNLKKEKEGGKRRRKRTARYSFCMFYRQFVFTCLLKYTIHIQDLWE